MPTISSKPMQYFGVKLSPNVVETPEGYLWFKDAVIARTGYQQYKGYELPEDELEDQGIDIDENDVVNVFRPAKEVFSKRTIASFEGKPVTDQHPGELVDLETHKELSKGHIQNVRQGTEPLDTGDLPLLADILVTDKDLINKWRAGIRELSCGYNYHLVKDGDNLCQTDIVGNHVAFVESGRAGKYVRVNDSKPTSEDEEMEKVTEFGNAIKSIATNNDEKTIGNFFRSLFSLSGNKAIAMDEEKKEKEIEAEDTRSDEEKAFDKRMHDALDRKLKAIRDAKKEEEAATIDDDEELAGLLAGGAGALKSKSTNGLDEEEEEEPEAEDEEEEEVEDEEMCEDEAVESNASPEISSKDRPKADVPRAVDAAYRQGAKDVLAALKPVVARSGDKRVKAAFDTAIKHARGAKPTKGSYAKFASATYARDEKNVGKLSESLDEKSARLGKVFEEEYKKNFRVFATR